MDLKLAASRKDDPITHAFRHSALVYDSDRELVEHVVPYLEGAIDEGSPAVAVLNRGSWAIVREALGDKAGEVSYTNADDFYVRPIRAVAAYDATLRSHAAAGATDVRVVGEISFGPTAQEWEDWAGYEAILNRALSHHAASVMCTYDTRVLPDRLIDVAHRTHPHVVTDEPTNHSRFEEPEAFVAALTPRLGDVRGLPTLEPCENVEVFRGRLGTVLSNAGVPPEQSLAMVVAAGEAFVNAARHGGGPRELRAGTAGGWFVCEVSDDGPGLDNALAGYLPPTDGRLDAGLWIARQLVSRLDLIPRQPGLTARLWL
jgi:anti-sigma regulatory factor (Ser/Thr protein kinase)